MAREPSYVSQLGAVLRQRDPAALRSFLLSNASRFGNASQVADVEAKSDAEMEELLHRMIVSRPDLRDLHRDSRAWLFRHGVDPVADGGQRN